MVNVEIYKGCDDLNGVICDSYVKNFLMSVFF